VPPRKMPRLVFSFLVTVFFAALLGLQALHEHRSSQHRIGITLGLESLVIESVTPGLPAAEAGLQAGDQIVEMAGSRLSSWQDFDRVAASFRPGVAQSFKVLRGDQEWEFRPVPGVPFPWLAFLPGLLAALGYMVLGLMVMLQPVRSLHTRLLYLLCCAIALEFAAPALLPGTIGWLMTALVYLLVGLQIGLSLHLVALIPARPRWLQRRGWLIPLAYGVGLAIGVWSAATVLSQWVIGWPLPWDTDAVAWFQDNAVLPIWSLMEVGLLLLPAARFPGTRGRHQARLVLLGLLPWMLYVWLGTGYEVLASALAPDWVYALEPFVLLAFPVALFVAIAQYQLFRIEMVLRRGLVYGLLTALLVGIFYLVTGVGSLLVAEEWLTALGNRWLLAASALTIGLLFFPLREALKRFVERRFFPERLALRRSLVELAAELPSQGKVPRMAEHLVERVVEIFALRNATVLVADPGSGLLISSASTLVNFERDVDQTVLLPPEDEGLQPLRQQARPTPSRQLLGKSPALDQCLKRFEVAWAVPLNQRGVLIGVLLMGSKRSRETLDAEERELVALLAHHLASTFENARLIESATIEGLTGLLRREAILERLDAELRRALRYRRPMAVGMIDLDHFKNVNDQYGHLAGDAMLKRVAGALARGLRTADSLGRYGGEEFLLVMPETELEGATQVAEKLRERVEDLRVAMADGSKPRVTLSIGLAQLGDADLPAHPTARELIAAADRSLYRAKKAGRNRVEPMAALG